MIRYVKGIVEEIREDSVILDNNGMGIRIFVTSTVLNQGLNLGDRIKIHTYFLVREDAMQLYGFAAKDELQVFELLLGVNGIGPKAAMAILSSIDVDDLRFAVLSDDAAFIAKAPGIGKKTAQKLILELKDKFNLEESFELKLQHKEEAAAKTSGNADAAAEAIQALVALGYSGTEALQAVKKVPDTDGMDSNQILKAALKFIF